MRGFTTTTHTFRGMPASASHKFTCPSCKKTDRQRTFRAECTVNPFNRGEDGHPLSPSEVRAQSQTKANTELRQFKTEPLCRTCEEALDYRERRALHLRRRGET